MTKAQKSASTFRQECGITIRVAATPQRIWALLTETKSLPKWNSTVSRIGGTIAHGAKLEIEVPAAPGRTFKPKVTKLEPNHLMVWSDGFAPMFTGVRTYTLTPEGDGSTTFSMVEVFTGVMLPLIKRSLPDFGPIFETYAADLKREAERPAT